MLLSHGRRFVEDDVERTVVSTVFLNEMQVLAALISDACNAQSAQQAEFHDTFAGDERLKDDNSAGVEVVILCDYSFDVVPLGGEKTPILERVRGAAQQLGFQVLGVPNAVVQFSAVAIDERDFLGGIHLRNRANTRAHKKPQVFVRRAVHVSVNKRRMLRVVNSGEDVGVHIVNRFALQNRL